MKCGVQVKSLCTDDEKSNSDRNSVGEHLKSWIHLDSSKSFLMTGVSFVEDPSSMSTPMCLFVIFNYLYGEMSCLILSFSENLKYF